MFLLAGVTKIPQPDGWGRVGEAGLFKEFWATLEHERSFEVFVKNASAFAKESEFEFRVKLEVSPANEYVDVVFMEFQHAGRAVFFALTDCQVVSVLADYFAVEQLSLLVFAGK